jgi:hypothetical protein
MAEDMIDPRARAGVSEIRDEVVLLKREIESLKVRLAADIKALMSDVKKVAEYVNTNVG